MSEYERRLAELAEGTIVAAWNPHLHPRGKDGRFIEIGGFVRGLFLVGNHNTYLTGKVFGIRPNKVDENDPLIDVVTPQGQFTTRASRIEQSAKVKADLDKYKGTGVDYKQPKALTLFEPSGLGGKKPYVPKPKPYGPPTPPKTLEQRIAEAKAQVNTLAEELDTVDPLKRAKGLDKIMGGVRGSPLSTVVQENQRGKSRDEWELLRAAKHEELWTAFLDRVEKSGVKKERKALVLGGLPGAGKTTSLQPGNVAGELGVVGWDTMGEMPEGTTHIVLNPDTIKELMIDAGMLPTGISDKIMPFEQASFIHAESNFLTQMFFQRMAPLGYNVVYDTTMANVPHVTKNIGPLAEHDYRFQGLFVDIPYQESRLSSMRRYIETWKHKPKGGRYVPSDAGKNDNLRVFNSMKSWFEDGWITVDNTGVSQHQAANKVTGQGTGDGSGINRWRFQPTDSFWRTVIEQELLNELENLPELAPTDVAAPAAPSAPVAAAATIGNSDEMFTSSKLVHLLRVKAITPEDGLALLKAGRVYVDDEAPDEDLYDEASKSMLHHALYATDAAGYADAYSEQISRLRDAGQTIDRYMAEPIPVTAAVWDPLLHPRGKDGRFIEIGGWIRGIFSYDNGRHHEGRGKVLGFQTTEGAKSAVIEVETADGEATALPAQVETIAPPKAQLVFPGMEDNSWQGQVLQLRQQLTDVLEGGTIGEMGQKDISQAKRPTEKMKQVEQLSTQIGGILDTEIQRRIANDNTQRVRALLSPEEFHTERQALIEQLEKTKAARHARRKALEDKTLVSVSARVMSGLAAAKNDPEYQKYEKELQQLIEQFQTLEDNRRIFRKAYSQAAVSVLDEVVDGGLGGTINPNLYNDPNFELNNRGKKMLADKLATSVGRVYPSSWIEKSNAYKTPVSLKISNHRAYYAPGKGFMALPDPDSSLFQQQAIHEYGHRMEDTVAGVKILEYAFYWRRVGDQDRLPLAFLYQDLSYGNEMARPDEFPTPYMGKDYGGGPQHAWELLTMAAEVLLSPNVAPGSPGVNGMLADTDLRSWMLGVLTTVVPAQGAVAL